MCFRRGELDCELAIVKELSLSERMGKGVGIRRDRAFVNRMIHKSSFIRWVRAIYSDSVEDSAVDFCLALDQDTRPE